MRFAVRRPGIPEASPRSHGVPRRDVPGRIHIRMAGETAGRTPEARLTLARLRIHVSACRTPLTRVMRLYLGHPAGRLLSQTTHQQSPARSQDLTIQPGFLADVLPRVFARAFRGSGHFLDLEVFDLDQVVATGDAGGGFLGPVFAPMGLVGVQAGGGEPYPLAAVRSAFGAGEFPLQTPQPSLLAHGQARYVEQLARRQGCGYDDAPVDPDNLAVTRSWNRVGNRGEGDVPASRTIKGDPVRLHAWRYRAGPAESHPPSLRHPDLTGLPAEPTYMLRLDAYDSEPLVPSGLPPRWPSSRVVWVEKRGHGLSKIPQCLLLHHLGACRQPRMVGTGCGELSALLQIARRACPARDASASAAPLRGSTTYRAWAQWFQQHRLLGGRGTKPVSRHTNTLANTTDIHREVKRRLLPGKKAGASTSRSR